MLKHLTFLVISTILLRSLTPANSINSFNFSLEDFCFLCFPVKKTMSHCLMRKYISRITFTIRWRFMNQGEGCGHNKVLS